MFALVSETQLRLCYAMNCLVWVDFCVVTLLLCGPLTLY
jgi:hypothetical protein